MIQINSILEDINNIFDLDIRTRCRKEIYNFPRFICMKICRENSFTLQTIGDVIGRDHSAVTNGLSAIEGYIENADERLIDYLKPLPLDYRKYFDFSRGEIRRTIKIPKIKVNSLIVRAR